MNALRVLLIDELRDLLDAEKQLTRALPKLARAASAAPLKAAFTGHLRETESHVQRLERALGALKAPVRGKPCPGMKGLISEGQEMMSELSEPAVRDAALIVSSQKVEHYEIAAYGSCKAFATLLGESEVVRLLEQTLVEEKAADAKLSALAEGGVNVAADASDMQPPADEGIFAQAAEWIRGAVSSSTDVLTTRRPRTRTTSAKKVKRHKAASSVAAPRRKAVSNTSPTSRKTARKK